MDYSYVCQWCIANLTINLTEFVALYQKKQSILMLKYLILLLIFASALANDEDKTLGLSEANPASSCNETYQCNPTSS